MSASWWRRLGQFLFAAILLSPASGWSLDPSRTVFQYAVQNWSRRNGLPVNGVKSITQSADGYLWLGTQHGIVRFDGLDFVTVPIPDDPLFVSQSVSAVAASRKGGVWFGLRDGAVGYYDGTSVSPLAAPWVDRHMDVFALAETRDGALWVGWNFGYGRKLPGLESEGSADRQIGSIPFHAVHEDAQGRIWLGAGDSGQLYYWENGKLNEFPEAALEGEHVYAIATDRDGNIWVGSQNGVLCYDPSFRRKALPPTHAYGRVNTILVDRHGVVWVGIQGHGVICYKNGKFTAFGKADGLLDDNVLALHEDAEGSLWIGTQGGLTQLSDVKFPIFSKKEGLIGEPLGVARSRSGLLWVAATNGITHFTGDTVERYSTEAGLINTWIMRVWDAKDGDLYVFEGDKRLLIMSKGRVVAQHQLGNWPTALAEDERGVIVSVGEYLFRASRDGVTPLMMEHGEAKRFGWVLNVWPGADGVLWVSTHGGVWRLQNEQAQLWTPLEGLPGTVGNWIFEDVDGAAWVGLASGIARIKDGKVRTISRTNGLYANYMHAIVPDDLGWFWFDSASGIFRVRRQELNDFADGKIDRIRSEAFVSRHAVKSADKAKQSFTGVRTADGRIWFPVVEGVVAIDPANVPVNRVPPPVYIERTRINGEEFAGTPPAGLSAGRGELEFHYTAVSFIAPEEIRFRYRLEGYDEQWIDAAGRRSAFYTNLRPGRYVFRVQARNADGVWSPEGDSLGFELPPHFYQTGWFFALGGLGGVLLLGGIYAWRTRVLRQRQRQLQEAHDRLEVGVRERTAELERANALLRDEIAERERMEVAAVEAGKQLLLATRQAGMAEVATSVLHNVGNVLNSVNVSAILLAEQLRRSRVASVPKLAKLLQENAATPEFLTADEKGRKVPTYLNQLSEELLEERARMREEVDSLRKNVEHIKDIVQMQQSYSRMSGVSEEVTVDEILDDTLRLNGDALSRHEVAIVRQVESGLTLTVEKHKLLQILVNLVRNATLACTEAKRPGSRITLRAHRLEAQVRIEVIDNGVGIAPENLTKIFTQGFTTRKNGHGYGLHSSANAAKAMGGQLSVCSAGLGQGATFTIELPLRSRPGGSAVPFTGSSGEIAAVGGLGS